MIIPNILRDMTTCAITDRSRYGSNEADRESGLLRQTAYLARNGTSFIQLREKDLAPKELLRLARRLLEVLRLTESQTRLLINAGPGSRADIAAAAGAHGLHLTSGAVGLSVAQARQVMGSAKVVVSVSCHTLKEVQRARENGSGIILFGPVFGKFIDGHEVVPGTGLELLADACKVAGNVPVLALGGVTLENAAQCLEVGAKGVAAIRLFQRLAE